MTIDNETLPAIHLIFSGVHLLYFIIYYGQYSTLNQKLNGVIKIEKASVVDTAIVKQSKVNISIRIQRLRKRCYYPIPFIALAHLIFLINILPENPEIQTLVNNTIVLREIEVNYSIEYWIILAIMVGSVALITIGNFTKGAHVFDPNGRFNSARNSGW